MAGQPTLRPHACQRCGEEHPKCLGHRKDGKPCGQNPLDFQDVCKKHGGKSPQALAAADRRRNRAKAEAAVLTYGEAREGDPFDLILEEIARTNGHVQWLAGVVTELRKDDLVWGRTSSEDQDGSGASGSHTKTVEAAGINIWLQLYQAERAHLLKACKDAIACGIAERQVRLAEQTGHVIAQVLRATLADPELKLPTAIQEIALRVVSRHLRALPAA